MSNVNVPAGIAGMVIAAQSGNHDPLDSAYRVALDKGRI